MMVTDLDRMPFSEYVEWRAFYVYEAAMADFEAKKARSRRG